MEIRLASVDDAPAIAGIYRHYVENTAATFECVAPTEDEMGLRIANILERYPCFVAICDNRVAGFAYANYLRARKSYDWSCEVTIYVAPYIRKSGIGKALYASLEQALKQMGVLSMYACIACPTSEDEYLTDASMRFHGKMGYSKVGEFEDCGNKFGRWYNIVWMKKDIGTHGSNPEPILPFPVIAERWRKSRA